VLAGFGSRSFFVKFGPEFRHFSGQIWLVNNHVDWPAGNTDCETLYPQRFFSVFFHLLRQRNWNDVLITLSEKVVLQRTEVSNDTPFGATFAQVMIEHCATFSLTPEFVPCQCDPFLLRFFRWVSSAV
jgi:hypothetical protein